MTIDQIGYALYPSWSREALSRMVETFGQQEAANRFAWLFGGTPEEASKLIDDFFAGNWVDDKGVKGGHFFWGDL